MKTTQMKKYLFIIFALLTLSSRSQTSVYHPMPDSSSVWNFQRDVSCSSVFWYTNNFSITISGDTIISSQTYHKLLKPFFTQFSNSTSCTGGESVGYLGAFRQETINKKVFFIQPYDSLEMLLYDFNMQVGDTVKGYIEQFASQKDTVISIDSILVGSDYRKMWKINQDYNIFFIEGIGSTNGLIEPSMAGLIGNFGSVGLTCFQQNGQSLYPDTSSNCELITSTNHTDYISNQINIYPNPSNGSFTIDFDKANIKEFRLHDLFGNLILCNQTITQFKISIDNLRSGMYILTLIDEDNRMTNRKIISSP